MLFIVLRGHNFSEDEFGCLSEEYEAYFYLTAKCSSQFCPLL